MSTTALGHGTRSVQIEIEVRATRRSDRSVTVPVTATQLDDDHYRITVADNTVGFVYRVGHVFVAMRGSRWDKAEECGQAPRWDLAVRQLVTVSGVLAEQAPHTAPRPQADPAHRQAATPTDGEPHGTVPRDPEPRDHARHDHALPLRDRVLIERAKGVLAERGGMRMAEASAVLRTYAHQNHLSERSAAMALILAHTDPAHPTPATDSDTPATLEAGADEPSRPSGRT